MHSSDVQAASDLLCEAVSEYGQVLHLALCVIDELVADSVLIDELDRADDDRSDGSITSGFITAFAYDGCLAGSGEHEDALTCERNRLLSGQLRECGVTADSVEHLVNEFGGEICPCKGSCSHYLTSY